MNSGPEPFGKYVLMERIAIGGMAEIFRARLRSGGAEDICIKRILPHYSEDDAFVNMFIDEASIAAKLQHENIVQIYDFDTVEGCYYIAMELINGRDLKQTLEMCAERQTIIPPPVVMVITQGLARSLQYAHTKEVNGEPLNIVHRDVSPHNVMLSFEGDIKLTDFGIAKAASRLTTTRAGTVKGKCAYMSPEQARGKTLDGRSDIFSVGILMYEMLTGQRLFTGESDFDILTKVLKEPITPPSQILPGLDPEIDRICMKALERDRDLRYGSCAALDRDAEAWIKRQVGPARNAGLDRFLKALFGLSGDPLPKPSPGSPAVSDEMASMAEMKTAMFNREDFASPNTPIPGAAPNALFMAGRTEAINTAPFQRDTIQAGPVSPDDEPSTLEMQPRLVVPAVGGASGASIHDEKTQALDISQFTDAGAPPPKRTETPPPSVSQPMTPTPRQNAPRPPAPNPPPQKKKGLGVVGIVLILGVLGFFLLLIVGGAGFFVFTQTDLLKQGSAAVVETDSGLVEADGSVDEAAEGQEAGGDDDNAAEADDAPPADADAGLASADAAQGDDNAAASEDAGDQPVAEDDDQDAAQDDNAPPEDGDKDVVADNAPPEDGDKDVKDVVEKDPPGDKPKVLSAEEIEERRKRQEEARKRQEATKGTGTLVINAVPYADVTVDGRRRGRTPVTISVNAGNHTVILSNPDKKDKKLFRVSVPKDQSKKVFHLFK